jgi:hypothetical protein
MDRGQAKKEVCGQRRPQHWGTVLVVVRVPVVRVVVPSHWNAEGGQMEPQVRPMWQQPLSEVLRGLMMQLGEG